MPISEDELDGRVSSASVSQSSHHRYASPYGSSNSCLSKAEQRKNNKPIMEKRRRARINQCLNELKTLILDATNKDPARHTKLEKADILEMTVKHLQSIQRQQLSLAAASDHTVLHKFKTGFSECALEVGQYIDRLEGVESGVKQRLINHLSNYMVSLDPLISFNSMFPPINPDSGGIQSIRARLGSSEDVNNNNSDSADDRLNSSSSALHLIPSRLPTGELALLLPNSSSLNSLFCSATSGSGAGATTTGLIIDRSHPSAFTAVSKDSGNSCKRPTTPEVSSTSNEPTSFPPFKLTDKSGSGESVASVNGKTDLSCLLRHKTTSSDLIKPITVYADPLSSVRQINSPIEITNNSNNVATSSSSSSSNSGSSGPNKSPLDFSLKTSVPPLSSSVRKKRPLEDLPCNDNLERPNKKLAKLDESVTDADDDRYSSDKRHTTATIEKSENMWRPW